MSTYPAASAYAATAPATGARHAVPLRIGLILGAALLVLSAIPAVSGVGLVGTAWDIVVVALAILAPLAAIGAVVLLPFAWHGRRRPSIASATMQFIGVGLSVPALLVPVPGAAIAGGLGVALHTACAVLVLVGMQRR